MNLLSIRIWLAKRSRIISMIILILFFILVLAVLPGKTAIMYQKGSITGQQLRHIGFVLKVDNKTEWKTDLLILAEQLNAEVNDILVAATASDKKMQKET